MPLTASIAAWVLGQGGAWALVLARVAGLAWAAPGLGVPALGWRIRLGLAGLLAAAVVPAVGPELAGSTATARALAVEFLAGAVLGGAAALIVAGARQAGEVVAAQAGLAPASLLDPEAGDDLTPLGHLYGLVALMIFLTLDGPLELVGALIESYRAVPAGGLPLAGATTWAFGRLDEALGLALRAAAPAALATASAGLALGLLGRAAPSLQFLALALPARAAIGLLLALIGLATLAATLAAAWDGLPMIGSAGAWPDL